MIPDDFSFSYKKTGLPSEEVDIKFETYRFYIQCFIKIINEHYSDNKSLILAAHNKTKHLQGFKGFDRSWVARFLKNAWNTEYLLKYNLSDDPEIARINNQWLPIQTYYAVYGAGEALSFLVDGNKAKSHRTCLRKLNNFLTKLDIPPWNLMYKGPIGKKSNEHLPHNFPKGIQVPHNLARRGVSPIEMACRCLRAEHKHRVDDEFKKEKGKYKYAFNPGYTSLLNFLYRLRIKSNYEGIDVFLAEAPDLVIIEFGGNLSFLCLSTMTLFEVIMVKKIGKLNFISIADEYLEMNQNALALRHRTSLYSSMIK